MGLRKKKKQPDSPPPPEPSAPPLDSLPPSPQQPYILPVYILPQGLPQGYPQVSPQGAPGSLYPQLPPQEPPAYQAAPVGEATEEDLKAQKKTEKRRKKKVGQKGRNTCIPKEIKALAALVTILLAIFDLYADGNASKVFIEEELSYLTYAILVILFISCVLFFLQIYAFYLRIKSLCDVRKKDAEHNDRDAILLRRENRYLCCAETSGYLLLLLEDAPTSAILVLVTLMPALDLFPNNGVDYCRLYIALFEESWAGWLALLASLVTAAWKFFLSFFYASACCCMEWGGIEGHCLRGLCCFFRVVRPIIAFFMFGAAFYIYYFFRQGKLFAQITCDIE